MLCLSQRPRKMSCTYLNLVLEYVPETVYRVSKHYSRANQRMPMIYVKLYTYQVLGTPTREEINCMNPNYTEFTRLILGTKQPRYDMCGG
ncbi:unnamed protein product [Brassica napus]|uniref:(rape) hypothetical protein n=1 Tax=Brassica napus TaxID=3708 RepID=A0A816VG26_BRANA|nr:unnamed protein product [Brassica napus]